MKYVMTPSVLVLGGLALVLLHLLPWIATAHLREMQPRDVFRPVNFLALLGLLATVYLFLLATDSTYLSPQLRITPWVHNFDAAVVSYVALTIVVFPLLVFGTTLSSSEALARVMPRLGPGRFTEGRVLFAAVLAGTIGLALYLYYLARIGGLLNLWISLYARTQITAGQGYLHYLYTVLVSTSAALFTYSLRFRQTRRRKLLVLVAVLSVAVILGSMGSRSGVISLVLLNLLVYHYAVRRFTRVLTPGTITLGTILLVFILIVPLFRPTGAFEKYQMRPELLVTDARNSVGRLAPQFSGFDGTAIMLSYFDARRLWWGRSYIDLAYAAVPRSMFPNKPPVDDGVYFDDIIGGREVRPSLPANRVSKSSWPMGTYTVYMNFGLPGLIAAVVLMGIVIGAAYRYMRLSEFNPFSIFVYQLVVIGGFSFSNYGMVNFAMTVSVAAAFYWLVFGSDRRRRVT